MEGLELTSFYEKSVENFKTKLHNEKGKGKIFTHTEARNITKSNPQQVRTWLKALVDGGELKEVKAYFFGCPKDKLLLFSSVIGNTAVCGHCNSELQYPNDNVETVTCPFCGAVYSKEQWHVLEKDVWNLLTEINYYAGKTLLEDIRVIVEGTPEVIVSWFTWLQSELSKLPFGNP
jgi:hypothetical protein